MLTLIEGPAGSAKSGLVGERIAAGESDVVADLTALWAALRAVERGPDGLYRVRGDADPAIVTGLAAYMRRVAVRQGLRSGLNVETVAAGWGDGRSAAPQRDWQASRLGPMPPESMVTVRSDAFEAVLAATGTPPSLFLDSDGTSQREAVRRWHLGTVLPLARLLQDELTEKLEGAVRLTFDNYPLDLAGRAQAFQKLVAGGVAVNEALATSGLLADG